MAVREYMLFCLAEHIRPYRELDRGLKVLARALIACRESLQHSQLRQSPPILHGPPATCEAGGEIGLIMRRQFDVVDCVSDFGRVLSALTIGACTEYSQIDN